MAQPRSGMRADARRNYERLLTEAHEVFTEHGTEAPLEEVARRAGVGIGTLYRRFPTREALLAALLYQRFEELRALAERLSAQAPGPALAAWLHAVVAHAATYRGLAASLVAPAGDGASALDSACRDAQNAGAGLLARAQAAGAARGDLTADELYLMAGAVAWAAEQAPAPDRTERLLELVLAGVRPRE